jgi:hypothetical protein
MNRRRHFLFLATAALAMAQVRGVAQEATLADPDLPQPLDLSVAAPLVDKPPFTRALNLSESLLLTGVAYVDGKPVATVKDVTTNKSYLVSEEPNAQGWRLAGASPSAQLDRAEVRLMIGTEIVPIRYSETQLTPQKKTGGYMPSRIPSREEFTGRDDKGEYVKASPYLSDADRDKFRNIPRETRDKFINHIHDKREWMFKASHEERATYVKKVFDSMTGNR